MSTFMKKHRGWRIAVWVVGILAAAFAAYAGFNWYKGGDQVSYYPMTAAVGSIKDTVQATATLEPVARVDLNFKNIETITYLDLQPGDLVKKGQVLARQETRSLSAQIEQVKNDVKSAEIQLANAVRNRNSQQTTWDRQQGLFAAGLISQAELDTARDNYEKAVAEVESSQAQLGSSRARMDSALKDLEDSVLTAPFDGVIGDVNGVVGQSSGRGSGNSTEAMIALISSDMQLKAMINEADIGRVAVGQEVELTSSAYPNKIFKGTVKKLFPEATTVSNVQFYPAYIDFEDPEGLLRAGMSITNDIIIARKDAVVTVPLMALTFADSYLKANPGLGGESNRSKDKKQRQVVVLDSGQPVLKSVKIGIDDGQNVEIVEGLSAGEQVVISTNQSSSSSAAQNSGTASGTRQNTQQSNQQNRPPGMFGIPH